MTNGLMCKSLNPRCTEYSICRGFSISLYVEAASAVSFVYAEVLLPDVEAV